MKYLQTLLCNSHFINIKFNYQHSKSFQISNPDYWLYVPINKTCILESIKQISPDICKIKQNRREISMFVDQSRKAMQQNH